VNMLTDKPTGSVINVTLAWPAPPDNRTWRYIDQVLMVLWLCGWASALVWPAGQLANGKADPFLVSWVAFWTLVGGRAAWALWASFLPARPEAVRLEAEVLRHDPGGRRWCWGRRAGREPTQVARSDIRGFVLERVGERQRLYLDLGAGRREIGAGLREPEREWLFAVLQSWHTPSQALPQTGPLFGRISVAAVQRPAC
jgi:hypothetical protein